MPASPDPSAATERDAAPALPLITVRAATGTGRTPLSAFDDALHHAGVGDLNLIPLSSVVPPGTQVVTGDYERFVAVHGDRLYCVMAVAHAELRGDSAWAGIGWVNHPTDGGYFVEHHAGSEQVVRDLIDLTLDDMALRRGRTFGPIDKAVIGARCEGPPVCALVVAAYESRGWGADA